MLSALAHVGGIHAFRESIRVDGHDTEVAALCGAVAAYAPVKESAIATRPMLSFIVATIKQVVSLLSGKDLSKSQLTYVTEVGSLGLKAL